MSRYADRAGALATAARWGFGPGRYDRTVHGSQSLAGRNRRPQLRLWRREQRATRATQRERTWREFSIACALPCFMYQWQK
ncbi:hypothetical protein CHLRE_09g393953v5 [Chlamydomonas reinhardtii]|uniref:Uncharacterized protein n=1 Tax=Chlamydomonas reinhardtii TaxID=3055 RepID=A0A2K3DDA7_CHLRE|nr:uncharacterized protein CHLRE_09g393953v5 [Chlamydomonas reinhardtii]PNW78516.1 hypothetical protein CHLRE_09g393953v5 [Chlamydomonas reinhardtii]